MDRTQLSPGRLRAILAVMAISLLAVISAVSGLNTALPSLATATGASITQLQWIADAYTVVFAGLLLISGAIGDRFGRKGILQIGLTIFAVAAAFALFSTHPEQLIVTRAFMGLGAACIMPTTLSVITTVFPPEQRARAVGVWVGIAAGGGIVGLFVAGVLLQFFDWSSFFAFNVVMAVIAFIGATLVVPKNRDEARHKLDAFGAVLSLLTVGGLVFGIIEGPSRGWTDALTLTALAVGELAGVVFVLWELRQEHPLLDPRLFRLRGFSTGSLSITLQFFTAFGFFFVGMQYLQFIGGLTPLMAAVCLLPMPFVVIPLSRVSAMIAEKRGFGVVAPIGLLLMASGYLVMSTMGTDFEYWRLLVGIVLFGAGMGFAGPPATNAIISSLPREKQGVASAVNDTSREVGSALGIAVLGSVLNQAYSDGMKPLVAHLPSQVADFLTSSIAWINTDAVKKLGPLAPKLIETAKDSYVTGIHSAFWVSAGVLILGAIVVAVRAPRPKK